MNACLYLVSHGRACSDFASARNVIRISLVVSPPNRPRWVHHFTFKEVVILARSRKKRRGAHIYQDALRMWRALDKTSFPRLSNACTMTTKPSAASLSTCFWLMSDQASWSWSAHGERKHSRAHRTRRCLRRKEGTLRPACETSGREVCSLSQYRRGGAARARPTPWHRFNRRGKVLVGSSEVPSRSGEMEGFGM